MTKRGEILKVGKKQLKESIDRLSKFKTDLEKLSEDDQNWVMDKLNKYTDELMKDLDE